MPIENVWESKGLHMLYTGELGGDEILSHVLKLASDHRIDSVKYIIGDFTGATAIDAEERHVKTLVAYNSALAKTNPFILNPTVLPNNELGQSLVSLYVLLTEGMPWMTEWFYSEHAARKWILEAL
ncbi:hypothetical protein [Oceanicoccus sp. KOV_DT_Chl]|uniref:hypothetical protein n=1 Tax=Oceanicoccus sp. KOV_DT_Chl TaxID=1904639 RepID=UPI000C7C6FF1|nr:hypothetical protein [Oceanicoccus sp. KOV_DT_Chl]